MREVLGWDGTTGAVGSGDRRLRLSRWPGRPDVGLVTPLVSGHSADRRLIRAAVGRLASAGCHTTRTSALWPDDRQAFEEEGFVPVAWLHLLTRSLDSALPSTASPVGLRRAHRADWPVLARLDARAFEPFWRLDEAALADARRATPFARSRVAGDAELVGYAIMGRSGSRGYVQRLGVEPAWSGRGIGAALLLDGLHWLQARDCTVAYVNTQVGNDRALRLYERNGFRLRPERLAVLEHHDGAV